MVRRLIPRTFGGPICRPIPRDPRPGASATGRLLSISIVGFFVALPFANVLVVDLGFPLTISHGFAAVAVVAVLRDGRSTPPIVTWLPASLFALFGIAYTLSFVANLGAGLPEYEWATGRNAPGVRSLTKLLWLLGNIAISLVVANAVRKAGAEVRAIRSLALGAALAAGYGVYQVISRTHGLPVPLLPGTELIEASPSNWIVWRATSTFLEPSFFGGFLGIALPFVAVAGLAGRRFSLSEARVPIAMLSIVVAGVLVTFAIGGWLPAAVGGIVLLLVSARRAKIVAFHLAASAAIAAVLVLLTIPNAPYAVSVLMYKGAIGSGVVSPTHGPAEPPLVVATSVDNVVPSATPVSTSVAGAPQASERPVPSPEPPAFEELTSSIAAVSAAERSALFRGAIRMFEDHPVFGVGPGNFGLRYPEYRPPDIAEPTMLLIANNVYAEVLAETGLVGFGSFLAGLGALGFMAIAAMRSADPSRRWCVNAGVASLAAMAAYFLLSPTFTLLYMWGTLGLVAACISRSPTNRIHADLLMQSGRRPGRQEQTP